MLNSDPTCIHGTQLTLKCRGCIEEAEKGYRLEAARAIGDANFADLTNPFYSPGGTKFDEDKPQMDLIDASAIEELSKVLSKGAKKYARHNWRKGLKVSRLVSAAYRHLTAINNGEDIDPETGLSHAAHLMCNAMFLIWTMKNLPKMDDRWVLPKQVD